MEHIIAKKKEAFSEALGISLMEGNEVVNGEW
jgi:hypothetical protein